MNKKMIELDGSHGEGGGQIVRSALSLSMITGKPFRIDRIRAGRKKPGLLRQHLTAVQAATQISRAEVKGAELGSRFLSFTPGAIQGGDYSFAIGSAGSCLLVLQTVLPALWYADVESTVQVSGGTHNPAAPPADFLIRSWLPLMQRMGATMKMEILRHGFYPAGGGKVVVEVKPVQHWQPLELQTRGEWRSTLATAIIAGLSKDIAQRELERASAKLGPVDRAVRVLPPSEGPGNALLIEVQYDHVTEVFTSFGEKGLSSERVADMATKEARKYQQSEAAVGEHLADQLVLPIALAGKGCFTTHVLSSHLKTNIEVIEKFLDVKFRVEEADGLIRVAL